MARPRFNPSAAFVAARSFLYAGVQYGAGDPFPTEGIAAHKLNTLYGSRAINMSEGSNDPIQMREVSAGRYEITAPWLDEPVKAHGKTKAEAALAEIREAGEPLDHHGVAVSEGEGGGWYEVKAEWLDEPEKVQGLEAAQKRANELRAEGPPPEHFAMVEVVEPEEEGEKYLVRAPWLAGVEQFETAEEAEARAQVIREAGPTEDFDPEAQPLWQVEAERIEAEEAEAREKLEAEQAEAGRKAAYSDAVTIASATENDVTTYTVSFPAGDPETFETAEAAEARQTAIREAGPPEGWQAPEAPAPTE